MKNEKKTMGFRIPKIWEILKYFTRSQILPKHKPLIFEEWPWCYNTEYCYQQRGIYFLELLDSISNFVSDSETAVTWCTIFFGIDWIDFFGRHQVCKYENRKVLRIHYNIYFCIRTILLGYNAYRAQSFTSLKADLRQDINGNSFAFSRCL